MIGSPAAKTASQAKQRGPRASQEWSAVYRAGGGVVAEAAGEVRWSWKPRVWAASAARPPPISSRRANSMRRLMT